MKLNRILFLALSVSMLMACRREGCTNQSADNYDEKANIDDGSCFFNGVKPNDPNNPGGGSGTEELPIHLNGTETNDIVISDKSTDPSVADYYIDGTWSADANVTIEPGVRIEMRSGARIIVKANGSINATGTPTDNIDIFGAVDVKGH